MLHIYKANKNMKIIRNYRNFNYDINSLSVSVNDIDIILNTAETTAVFYILQKGYNHGLLTEAYETYVLEPNEAAIVDRVSEDGRKGTMLRDRVVVPEGLESTLSNKRVYKGKSRKKIRAICRERGAEKRYVQGGIPPLTYQGQVAVPDFNMSGTNWFIMPEKILMELVDDYVPFVPYPEK